ncbi:MAG: hypothetical protein MHPSP_001657 [Paramarteilia canceri]
MTISTSIYTNNYSLAINSKSFSTITGFSSIIGSNDSKNNAKPFISAYSYQLPFVIAPDNNSYSSLDIGEEVVFLSYGFTSDSHTLFSTIMNQSGVFIQKKCFKVDIKSDIVVYSDNNLKLSVLQLMKQIITFVNGLEKNCHIVITKVGAIDSQEFNNWVTLMDQSNLSQLLDVIDSNSQAEKPKKVENIILSITLLSSDLNRFLQFDNEAFSTVEDGLVFSSPMHQSYALTFKLSTTLSLQTSVEDSKDDDISEFLDNITSNDMKCDDIDIIPELQNELDEIFDDELHEENSLPSENSHSDQNRKKMSEFDTSFLNGKLKDPFFRKGITLEYPNEIKLSSLPLSLSIFVTPVYLPDLPRWMQYDPTLHSNKAEQSNVVSQKLIRNHKEKKLEMYPFSISLLHRSDFTKQNDKNCIASQHPLLNSQNTLVIEWIINKFNQQSYLNHGFLTGRRSSGLPIHMSSTIQLMVASDNILYDLF